jgi:hydroxymethylpyrimidine pyrophosphatase-like HAD family hydrolase
VLHLSDVPSLAIGDATNDLPMFAAATHAAAVANASPDVIASGIHVASAPFGHGVAEIVLSHLDPSMLGARTPTDGTTD